MLPRNLRTAKTLGLDVSKQLQQLADGWSNDRCGAWVR